MSKIKRLKMKCERCGEWRYIMTITPAAPNEHLCLACAALADHAPDDALAAEAAQEQHDRRAAGYPA